MSISLKVHVSVVMLSFVVCGVFGKYTGPVVPPEWISPDQVKELKRSNTKFPWVVDIFKG